MTSLSPCSALAAAVGLSFAVIAYHNIKKRLLDRDCANHRYSIADQQARFASAKAQHNLRVLDIDSVYDPSYFFGKTVIVTGAPQPPTYVFGSQQRYLIVCKYLLRCIMALRRRESGRWALSCERTCPRRSARHSDLPSGRDGSRGPRY